MKPIETERLIIREFTPDDLDAYHRVQQEAFHSKDSRKESETVLEWTVLNYRQLERLYQPPYGDYAIVAHAHNQVVGTVGLVPTVVPWSIFGVQPAPLKGFTVSPEFGLYWGILPSQWGHGYAPEAAQAFITMIFEQLHAARVVATTSRDNISSQRVMHKLGMKVLQNPTKEPHWFEVVGVLYNLAR